MNQPNITKTTPSTTPASTQYRTYLLASLVALLALLLVVCLQCFRSMVIVTKVQAEHDTSIAKMLEHGMIDVDKVNQSLAKAGAAFTLTQGSLANSRAAAKHLVQTPSLEVLDNLAGEGFWLSLIAAGVTAVLLEIVWIKRPC
jgi:hypothetical protein